MKANEAPEKIYIQSFNVSEEDAKFERKLYFDDVWTEEPESGQENIEYIRKDAFIEKAAEFLYNYNQKQVLKHGARATLGCGEYTINVEDFINYIKGE